MIKGYDPVVRSVPRSVSKVIQLKGSIREAIQDAHLIVVATEWPEFRELDQETLREMKDRWVVDPNAFLAGQLGHGSEKYVYVGKGYTTKDKS